MKLIINLNEIKDLSQETCLVGFYEGVNFSKKFDVLDHDKVHFIVPNNIIAINLSFLAGFFKDLSQDPERLNNFTFSDKRTNEKLKELKNKWLLDSALYRDSLEDSDFSEIAHIARQFKILDGKMARQSYITKTDIYNTDLPKWVKWMTVFLYKRSSDFHFHYILDNVKYESKYDIEKSKRDKAELYFTPSKDSDWF